VSELVTLACCDLSGLARGRAVPAGELDAHLRTGVGWVPANHALTPHGPVAEDPPFGSVGDLRLLPDPAPGARARVGASAVDTEAGAGRTDAHAAFDLILCDIVETDGGAWTACPRACLRAALEDLRGELGCTLHASFEHEFQLLSDEPPEVPFSVVALRRALPFTALAFDALAQAGIEPERVFAEYAPHQFEIPVAPAQGLAAADRAVLLREVVREVARRCGTRATFTPLLDPGQAGNGVHVHLSLRAADGAAALYDPAREGCLSELGGSFAAGVLRHARALCALTAPSPVSAGRLQPHNWSAGAVCVGERNREALLRIPPLVTIGGADRAQQMRLEYRACDACANPYVVLAAIVYAGIAGVREGLRAPPVLDRDPAELGAAEAQRFGVGALPASLADAHDALAGDEHLRGSLPALLYDAHVAIKRSELAATADLDPAELCARYARIY
jgi:glutamine synthetase